jgi:hypothetical protein
VSDLELGDLKQRILTRFNAGFSYSQIAAQLGYSYSWVSKLGAQAREEVREATLFAEDRRRADDRERRDFRADATGKWGAEK